MIEGNGVILNRMVSGILFKDLVFEWKILGYEESWGMCVLGRGIVSVKVLG